MIAEKAEMEKKVAEAQKNAEAITRETTTLKDELNSSIALANQAEKERNELQNKLVQLQESWEKYVAS